MGVRLELLADEFLRANGAAELTRERLIATQIFEPFLAPKPVRAPLSGPVSPRAKCERCQGPRSLRSKLCRSCARMMELVRMATTEDYWRKLERRREPDFAPALLELIYAREKEVGPAARWPASESVL